MNHYMWKQLFVGNHDKDYHDATPASKEHSAVRREPISQLSIDE